LKTRRARAITTGEKSMPRYHVDVAQQFNAPVEAVFRALADHNKLGRVLGIPVKRVVNGMGEINGVGSVRRMGLWPVTVEETVVNVVPNRTIDYRISKGGAPLSNHEGALHFSPAGTGSRVNWQISFDAPPVLGAVVKQVLTQGLRLGLKRVKP
jgi:uncharacterized protein YndB with AHSA1/START domain